MVNKDPLPDIDTSTEFMLRDCFNNENQPRKKGKESQAEAA
jgi:hypothetical protein